MLNIRSKEVECDTGENELEGVSRGTLAGNRGVVDVDCGASD